MLCYWPFFFISLKKDNVKYFYSDDPSGGGLLFLLHLKLSDHWFLHCRNSQTASEYCEHTCAKNYMYNIPYWCLPSVLTWTPWWTTSGHACSTSSVVAASDVFVRLFCQEYLTTRANTSGDGQRQNSFLANLWSLIQLNWSSTCMRFRSTS